MADETYRIKAEISADTSKAEQAFREFGESLDNVEKSSDQAGVSIGKLAAGEVIGNLLSKAFNAVSNSLGKAISRVDTLNNYPKVMESLGYATEDADASIKSLGAAIEGLPTTLDEIVGSTQQLTASLGDLDKGTETAIALNDMFLAGGQGAEAASRAFTQYNQMISKGKVDMQSWNTLMEVAPGQLNQLAKEMLGAEADGRALYAALQDGTVSMTDLNNAIIRLDQEGGEGFASFHDQALTATGGIGTAITNLKSAVTKGVANMIQNFQDAASDNGLPTISDTLTKLKTTVNNVFTYINKKINKATSALAGPLKATVKAFDYLTNHIEIVMDVVGTAVTAFAAFKIVTKVQGWISALNQIIAKQAAVQALATAATTAGAAAETADTVATTADATAKTADAAATGLATKAQLLFNAAISANPVMAAVTAIIALVGALKLLSDILPDVTADQQAAIDSFNEVKDAVDGHVDSYTDGRKAYKKYDKQLQASGDTQERLNAAEKEASDLVEARIQNEEDLAAAIAKRNELKKQWDEIVAKDESMDHVYTRGTRNQNPVYQSYMEAVETVNKLGEQHRAIEVQEQVHQQNMAKIQATALEEEKAGKQKAVTYEEWKQKQLQSIYAMERADLYHAVQTQTVTYDQLSEKNQATIDRLRDQYQDFYTGASDMFSSLTNDFGESANEYVAKMQEVLIHNQTVVAQMGENMNSLRDYFANAGLDTALLDQLERMGTDGAAPIAALTTLLHDGTEESKQQLADLANSFGETSQIAASAVESSISDAAGEIASQTEHLWAQQYESLSSTVEGTNWAELSQACIEGIAEGFDDTSMAINKAKEFGIDLDKGTKEGAGVNSPSWKYEETARMCVEGAANGFNKSDKAVNAARRMGEATVNALNGLPAQMYQVGMWSGQGFVNGLAAMEGSVLSVANSIANSVSSTISNALQVGSPSKVTTWLAKMTGKGLVVGLESMMGAVRRAADNLLSAGGQLFAPDIPTAGYTYNVSMPGNSTASSLQGQINDLKEAILKQPIMVDATMEMDGKEVGRITAPFSRAAINKLNQTDAYRKGTRVIYGTV